jgi:alpha-tubulin suppressor-like RCC1 family protein
LGHANREAVKHPKLVEFFDGKSIKVQEAICGEHHTVVLGENGKVYTCGYGGKKANPFMRLFINYAGALGHGAQDSYSKPKLVRALEEQKIERITAGSKFNIVINDKGQVYHWGNGEFGVFGDGGNKDFSLPTKNEYFEYL